MKSRLFVALLLMSAALLLPTPAYAAACSGSSGVTVVVQFPDGHTEIGCAPGDPSSGVEALKDAGFSYVFVPNQPGAVCTINGQPSDRRCWAPPKTWSYWHADRGGSWEFSKQGASGRNPAPGSVEGWRFGTNAAPTTRPPGGAPSTPKPEPTKKPAKKPAAKPVAKPSKAPGATATVAPTATPSAGATPSAPASATATASGAPTAAATGAAPESAATASASGPSSSSDSSDDGSSSGLSWVWGLVLIAVLAGAGGVVAVRRRG